MSLNRSTAVLAAFSLSACLTLSACGSDKGGAPSSPGQVDASAQGLFSGDLISNSGNSIGVLNLQVPNGAAPTANLNGVIDAEILDLAVSGTHVEKEVPVPGLTSGVKLNADYVGGRWIGSLSTSASKTVYSFSLMPTSELRASSETERLAPEGEYAGKFAYPSGGKRAAKILVAATADLGERLLGLFTPQTAASIQVVYDGGAKESVSDAVWNSDQRTLMAVGTAMTSMGAPQLQCVLDEMENLDCVLAMGKQSVGKGKFVRTKALAPKKAKPAAVPKPVPTPKTAPGPAPAPAADVAVEPVATPTPTPAPVAVKNFGSERTFYGKATFREGSKSQVRDVMLEVSLMSPDLQGPGAARVTFRVRDSRVGANFRMSLYDSIEKTLKAEARLTAGALAGSLVLECQNFDFKASPYQFTCHYESTSAGVTGAFVMSGK